MGKKVLIVGGVAGGASAAARLRRLDESAEIIMFERDEHISFANCGLPYYIGETIKEREKLLVQTPEAMKARFAIDVRINSEVTAVDTKNKKVSVRQKDGKSYEESYDYLILSPGAKPLKPPIPGIESKRIHTLRNVADTDRIKAAVDSKGVKKAVVIGGGYIGVEMAENLRHRGVEVTLVEAAPHILAPFDSDMVALAEKVMEENGVQLILNDGVKSFDEEKDFIKVTLNSGKNVTGEMAVLAIGVSPDTAWLKDSGIELAERGHIIVDDHMRTSAEGVYAAGDAVLIEDYITGGKAAIPLAGPANRQGRIAADNIAGIHSSYKGTMGTSIIKVFDLTAASTGNNERLLQRAGIDYKVVFIHPMSHASYYPDATELHIKLIFDEQGKILGAQAMGYDGVDKVVDVIATAIKFGGTVEDLTELELAYAPPYLSAKSPANMAGFVAQNILKGGIDTVKPEYADTIDKDKEILLDVRDAIEVEQGAIPGHINIPVNELRERLNELMPYKDKEIIIYCAVGLRGYIASRILNQQGFKTKNITGGYKSYTLGRFKPSENIDSTNQGDNDKDGTENSGKINITNSTVKEIDASGLCCPGPLMRVKMEMDMLKEGDILKVKASDPGFYEDIKAWTTTTKNQLIDLKKEAGIINASIKKCTEVINNDEMEKEDKNMVYDGRDGKTIIVFSGDLDKAIASFIIANGAASMGKKVTMFFTFWGLNILRKEEKVNVHKSFIEKAFGMMMPRGSKKLGLSRMNMGGFGAKMIRGVMKDKNIQSLEDLIKAAIDNGVNIVACTMSMDVMGITAEELIPGVNLGGVGYYLGEAEGANVNLFI
ncbi:FAD-dependent oxidoreductase [Clostridium polynesiense]|uniref:FAD-dependent oxidoreductase n=1 Tax=Clostridium polynesiense TaxID=1325933 RepID=UPI00058F0F78|nr:FAD-dependent oxidoreductase [Clostridium polynesiense]